MVAFHVGQMNYTYKNIWLITYPVMMSVLMEQLLNITDAIFLGHVGETELGASAIAGMYYLVTYIIGFGFCIGLQVVIARRNGEKNYPDTGKTFFQGLWFLCGLAVTLLLLSKLFAPSLMQAFITSDEIRTAVMKYVDGRSIGLLFAFPALALRTFFVGTTQTRILSINAFIMVAANVGLNYLLIFGKAGFPTLGIAGAALASTLSELISLGILIIYVLLKIDRQKYGLHPVFDSGTLWKVLQVSVWSMMHSFLGMAPWFLFFVSVEHLGQSQLAIANIIRSISTLLFVIVSSFASVTASLVSNLIGARQQEEVRPLCARIIRLGYGIGLPLIILALLFHKSIIGIYTADENLIDQAFIPYIVMLSNYFLAMPSCTYLNAVAGTGATRRAFVFQIVTLVFYLMYLHLLNTSNKPPLAVYCTVEHLFVTVLLVLSITYINSNRWLNKIQYDTRKQ